MMNLSSSTPVAHEDLDFQLSTLTEQNVNERRLIMRRAILVRGIPRSLTFTRGDIWKLLLGVTSCDADRYLALVVKGESEYHEQIKHDASRTFRDRGKQLVPEDSISRILNALIHAREDGSRIVYIQGLNVVCGIFLYVMAESELDTFCCLEKFVKFHCAKYYHHHSVANAIREGCDLVMQCIKEADAQLYDAMKPLNAQIVFLGAVMTMNAFTPRITEMVLLWDFLLAGGMHLSIFAIAARCVLLREKLLNDANIHLTFGQGFPQLTDAAAVISLTAHLYLCASPDLQNRAVRHMLTS